MGGFRGLVKLGRGGGFVCKCEAIRMYNTDQIWRVEGYWRENEEKVRFGGFMMLVKLGRSVRDWPSRN